MKVKLDHCQLTTKMIRIFLWVITMVLALHSIMVPASSNEQRTEVMEDVSRTRSSLLEVIRSFQHHVLDEMKYIKQQVDGIRGKQEKEEDILRKLEEHDSRLDGHHQYIRSQFEPKCPAGFDYLPEANGCYVVVFEQLNWTDSRRRCQEINPRAHSVVIETQVEDNAVRNYLDSELTKGVSSICVNGHWRDGGKMVWTSGQRITLNSCQQANPQLVPPFVWKPFQNSTTIPLNYTNWVGGTPDCYGNREDCLHHRHKHSNKWNDIPCASPFCALCEILPLWN